MIITVPSDTAYTNYLTPPAAIIATHGRVVTHENGLAVVGAHATARVEGGSVYLANRSVLEQPPHPDARVWMLSGSVYFDHNLAPHITGSDYVGIWADGEIEYVDHRLVEIPPLIQTMLDAAPGPAPDGVAEVEDLPDPE